MKKTVVVALALLFLFGALSMSRAQEAAKPAKSEVAMPSADADKVSEYMLKDHPYKKWKLFPGTKKMHKGGDPHGTLLTTYVNHVAMDSIKKKTMFAEGSMIVKENYTADKKMVALTTMYKVKGFNPDAGDWFWISNAPDGKVQASGKVTACIDCHAKAKATDYVFTKMPK
jgi:hypothetical protein